MTIKGKLGLLSAIPAIGMVLGVLATVWIIHGTSGKISECKDQYAEEINLAHQMQLDVVQVQQFLTDYSATRGQDGLDDGIAEATKFHDDFLVSLKKFKALAAVGGETDETLELDAIAEVFGKYWEAGNLMAQAYAKDGTAAGNKTMGAFDQAAEHLSGRLEPFIKEQSAQFQTALAAV